MQLNVHSMLAHTRANGPGDRLAIWLQGCGKACPGCFNPETWNRDGGKAWEPRALARWVREQAPEGLTLTGGDPLEQAAPLMALLRALHEEDGRLDLFPRGILLYTGMSLEEIADDALVSECVSLVDLIVTDRYDASLRVNEGMAGSKNQRLVFSTRPGRGLARIPEENIGTNQIVEVHAYSKSSEDAQLVAVTGFPKVSRKWLLERGIHIVGPDADL